MFFHAENQQMLWRAIQKSPYFLEFSQKYAGHKETWFQGISEQFYSNRISHNGLVPTNAKELLEMNKRALEYFVLDLKRLLGYHESVTDPLSSYNVAKEKQTREETNAAKFNNYQEEYGRLLQRPALPQNGLPSESAANQKIKNMDELLVEQAKLREMDLAVFSPKVPPPNDPVKLKIFDEIEKMEMISFDINEIGEHPQQKSVSWSNAIEETI